VTNHGRMNPGHESFRAQIPSFSNLHEDGHFDVGAVTSIYTIINNNIVTFQWGFLGLML
jgi:hypothetical protein